MTTITPDFPDWTPGQVSAAASRLLYQSAAYEQLPVTKGLFDVRAYNSVYVVADSHDTASLSPVAITVYWQTQGITTHVDFLTMGNGYTSPSGVNTASFALPCRGDYCTVRLIGGNPQRDIFVNITATSRQTDRIVAVNSSGNEGSILAYVETASLAAGGVIPLFFGPVSGSFDVGVAADPSVYIRTYTWKLINGNWTSSLIGGTMNASALGAAQNIACPLRFCEVLIVNGGTAAHPVSCWVTDAG